MIIFTNDLHIDRDIWVDITINYLSKLEEYATQYKIKTIIFGGDVFEKASKIRNEVFVPFFLKLMELKEKGFELYFILGNHDIFNDYNDSIVETFAPFGTVIKDSATLTIDNFQYDLLSYTKDETKIPNKSKVLLTHLSIADFQFDNGYEADQKNGMSTDLFSNYDLVVSGHFHRHQEKKNIVYVGSPFQHNFGEEGQQKGFLVLDKDSYQFVEYNEAPTFLTIKAEDFLKYDYKNKFVQVEITNKVENFIKLKHILYDKGAIEVKSYFKKQNEDILLDAKKNLNIDENGSVISSLREYLRSLGLEKIDNEKLISYFDELIKEL